MPGTLRLGSRGPDVARLQSLLNSKLSPSPNLDEDGDFGPRTGAAVQKFQSQAGLSPDGVVGPKTWSALQTRAGGGPQPDSTLPSVPADAPWLAVARQELKLGVHEIPGAEANPRIIQYHATTSLKATSDETAWCSSFVNWCLKQVGVNGTNSAAAASWVNWGQNTAARPGAVTVIYNAAAAKSSLTASGNHVGFLIQETKTHYSILGGNQSDQMKVSNFPKSKWALKAYRWPKK